MRNPSSPIAPHEHERLHAEAVLRAHALRRAAIHAALDAVGHALARAAHALASTFAHRPAARRQLET